MVDLGFEKGNEVGVFFIQIQKGQDADLFPVIIQSNAHCGSQKVAVLRAKERFHEFESAAFRRAVAQFHQVLQVVLLLQP
ncbi:MAG: Uncharacterised protein [Flavobacteriia bacterium]|nr:MAG: Uncharacterised protein [Flavobacteriia bacterium]